MSLDANLPPVGTMDDAQLAPLAALVLGELVARRLLSINVGSVRVSADTTWIGVTATESSIIIRAYPNK